MKQYQINYKRLVLLLLPTFLRRPRIFALLYALTFGISKLHSKFIRNRDENLLRIKRNGQKCYLQGMLNDELDPEERRIRITDGDEYGDWVFAFDEEEPYQLFVDSSVILFYSEDLIINNTDVFYVSVPKDISQTDLYDRLCNYLNQYKLSSKKYKIR